MALAKYFSKDLLAINRLIKTDNKVLEEKLISTVITIAFDKNATSTYEGQCALDLIVRLLARLYPKLKIIDLSDDRQDKKEELVALAKEINSNIEIIPASSEEDLFIVLGATQQKIASKGKVIYLGSDNWVALYSDKNIMSFGDSENPFGSGVAACTMASNIFRYVFSDLLSGYPLDNEFQLSSFSLSSEDSIDPILEGVEFDDIAIAGIGAIGNGTVWALSKLKQLKGTLSLIDNESVSISNLQRYALFVEKDEGRVKVDVAQKFFKQSHLTVDVCQGKWADYVSKRNNWDINCVAVGIDNAKDRIGIQSTLPQYIFNAFTEPESIGISRHMDFSASPCLACSYIPDEKEKDYTNEVADNCNIPSLSNMVKDYLNLNLEVNKCIANYNNKSLLSYIAEANRIDLAQLSQFEAMTVEQFYSNFVCGGVILSLSKSDNDVTDVDAPLAFQSALAGILLAAELVKHSLNLSSDIPQRTDVYHLTPIADGYNPYNRQLEVNSTGRCFCSDTDYLERYKEKWMI